MSEDKASVPPAGGHRLTARRLMRSTGKASLATVMAEGGAPYASMVTVAFDLDGSPVMLLSRLADHTRNILADCRVALLFDATAGYDNPQEGPRLTLLGSAAASVEPRLRRRFLARHPAAAPYAGFTDFSIYKVTAERGHLVGGFARAVWLTRGLMADAEASRRLGEAEEDILAHMNADHAEAIDLYATRLLGGVGSGWRMTGIDPDGCDLRRESACARLDFSDPVSDPQAAVAALRKLAERARATPRDRPA